jgi:hypothetical protein
MPWEAGHQIIEKFEDLREFTRFDRNVSPAHRGEGEKFIAVFYEGIGVELPFLRGQSCQLSDDKTKLITSAGVQYSLRDIKDLLDTARINRPQQRRAPDEIAELMRNDPVCDGRHVRF